MKKLLTIAFLCLPFLVLAQTSIYDIQYTSEAGGGTWPSTYAGQTVTTGGIVTVANYNGGRYFIGSSTGGAWSGLFIYDNTNAPAVGDSIVITGLVYEYNGMTEIKDVTSFDVISSGNALPPKANIATSDVTDEAYEGVLVQVSDVAVAQPFDEYDNWSVDDGSGTCVVRGGIYNLANDGFPLFEGYPFAIVSGIVTDYYGACLLPRYRADIQSASNAFVLFTNDHYVDQGALLELPVKVAVLNQTSDISEYTFSLTYDASVVAYQGFEKSGTLSEPGTVTDNSTSGNINITFSGNVTCNDVMTLIKLKFSAVADGIGDLQFTSSTINGSDITHVATGELLSGASPCDIPSADTLTIVQRPLLNIPTMAMPGETFEIECFAPQSTTGWSARLLLNNLEVDLEITSNTYDATLDKWTLQTTVPAVEFFELYDLEVSANDLVTDTAANAVRILDQYKTDYYFVHITDAHLPGHTFWGDPGYETDDTEIADMEAVIEDINLINPEFVLFTGDVLNEGEMEDFECLRHHTKVVELLQQFEVPVYVVPGNHDLGGWEATPPSQGTARRDWWRFFGWRQRIIPPVQEAYYTHDYSFDYGNVHFTGLESSDNYDGYMYEVYGEKGFIPSQLTWLSSDLAAAGNKTKVLFYHYDFNDDIDLTSLGADMALWGHTHSDTDDYTHPYNIGTDNICDETSAYRVIRVSDGTLTPESTVYARDFGDNQSLEVTFSAENNGLYDSLGATITNNHNQNFTHAQLKFVMPEGNYTVTNGTLQQIIPFEGKNICYVEVALEANSTVDVTVEKSGTNAIKPVFIDGALAQNYPNPFSHQTKINFALKNSGYVQLSVYNSAGQQIKTLVNGFISAGNHTVTWNGTNDAGSKVPQGIYFYKFVVNGKQIASRQMVVVK
ncbi:flagellar basal body rod modification protein [Salinivirga cyanobacteriivorans]|uniref:Flagellar basal body rod modification protein n=1 Tax=Salinivirga cyanobacteriivorans TaxID=1307839 RepID=A0A0S2HYV1_9BACT|nr:metallophosphoesterase [Salinivirga cyanobacteriivorans]ALO15004.1 flagellar basal body rod modification protein [Salinivirga cyanobacteriivorans]